MDDEDIQHWHELIAIKKRRRRKLERQEAKYGLNCPPEIQTEIEDLTREIKDLDQKIRRRIKNAGNNTAFRSDEEVDEIYDRTAEIASLKRGVHFLDGLLKILKSLFYWKNQDK